MESDKKFSGILQGLRIIQQAFDDAHPPLTASQRDALSVAPNGASIIFVLEGRFVFGMACSLFAAKFFGKLSTII